MILKTFNTVSLAVLLLTISSLNDQVQEKKFSQDYSEDLKFFFKLKQHENTRPSTCFAVRYASIEGNGPAKRIYRECVPDSNPYIAI
jgi:hypothetical protein